MIIVSLVLAPIAYASIATRGFSLEGATTYHVRNGQPYVTPDLDLTRKVGMGGVDLAVDDRDANAASGGDPVEGREPPFSRRGL